MKLSKQMKTTKYTATAMMMTTVSLLLLLCGTAMFLTLQVTFYFDSVLEYN